MDAKIKVVQAVADGKVAAATQPPRCGAAVDVRAAVEQDAAVHEVAELKAALVATEDEAERGLCRGRPGTRSENVGAVCLGSKMETQLRQTQSLLSVVHCQEQERALKEGRTTYDS